MPAGQTVAWTWKKPVRAEWTLPPSTDERSRMGASGSARVRVRRGQVEPEMTADSKQGAGGYRDRSPRIAINCTAVLTEGDGCELDVVILDVSRAGFRLQSRSELEVGSEVLLSAAKLEPVRALIRWTCGHEAGGVFLDPVAL
jgi:hypothetical protein